MTKLEATFTLERDTKRTRRFAEEPGDGRPVIGTLYIQRTALEKLTGGPLPERVKVTIELPD